MPTERQHSPDRVLFYCFLTLMVWLPLPLGSNRIWAVSIMEIAVFAMSITWLILYLKGKVRINRTFKQARLPISLLFLFVIWTLVQSLVLPETIVSLLSPEAGNTYSKLHKLFEPDSYHLSLSTYHSTGKAIESLTYALLFCLTPLLIKTKRRLKLLVIVIIGSGVFQAVYGSLMTLSGVEYAFFIEKQSHRNVATGTFLNRNHLAGYLEMSLALGIGLLISGLNQTPAGTWREVGRRLIDALLGNKIKIRIALAIMVIAMVLTHSRMGNAAFFSSLSIMGIIYIALVKNPPRSVIILFVSLILIDVVIVGTWFGLEKVIERLEKTEVVIQEVPAADKTTTTKLPAIERPDTKIPETRVVVQKKIQLVKETRDETYRDTRTMINDFILTGTGGGTYFNSFHRYQQEPYYGYYDHTHNDYLEFLSEYGIIGSSLLGSVVILAFSNALIAIRKSQSILLKGLAFSSAMGIMAIMLHSTVDFNLQIPSNAALFILLLALAWIVRYKKI